MVLESLKGAVEQIKPTQMPESKMENLESERPTDVELPQLEGLEETEISFDEWELEDGSRIESQEFPSLESVDIDTDIEHFSEETEGETSESNEENEKREGLTDEEKAEIKKETGWSDEIINAIESMEEYEVYKEAGLVETEINGKKCLIRNDIDWDQKDAMGRTNRERAEQGLSPINKDGKVIELHHIGQHKDSPLAELTTEEHRGKGNDAILHNKDKESEIDRQEFARERSNHWQARTNEGGDQ